MKRKDLWLDSPINIEGDNGSSYPEVVHISTAIQGCEYVEDVYGEILYLDEMDNGMIDSVCEILEDSE